MSGYVIHVDEQQVFPGAKPPFHRGSCHMFVDGDIERLHEFALRIGLKREWFQPHRVLPHYDLTPPKRKAALTLGAQPVQIREYLRTRKRDAQIAKMFHEHVCPKCGATHEIMLPPNPTRVCWRCLRGIKP